MGYGHTLIEVLKSRTHIKKSMESSAMTASRLNRLTSAWNAAHASTDKVVGDVGGVGATVIVEDGVSLFCSEAMVEKGKVS